MAPNKNIFYSDKYADEKFEYRHVVLPKDLAKMVPKSHLMSESEWRNLGVQQSQGWVHYMAHEPEPHILLFRRPLNYGKWRIIYTHLDDDNDNRRRPFSAKLDLTLDLSTSLRSTSLPPFSLSLCLIGPFRGQYKGRRVFQAKYHSEK